MRYPAAIAAAAALVLGGRAHAAPYTQPAPPMQTYIDSLGFLPPTDPGANLDARSPQHHAQLEAYLLEGAEAGSMTGDPVLLAWFAGSDASLAPWTMSNCGDYNKTIDFDCPWGTLWQVGLGCQVTYNLDRVAEALAATHAGESAQVVGQQVLDTAAQSKTFPALDVAAAAADPAGVVGGMQNAYWLATLMRDMALGAYLEAPPATAWPCYLPGYPAWCNYYRQPAEWQAYSDVLSQVIISWNQIQADWAAALVPDVIVDDMSAGFSVQGAVIPVGKGGWRGHFYHAAAGTPGVTVQWIATVAAGTYRVSAFIPYAPEATAPDATMTIHASGGPVDVNLDQSQVGGRFVAVGEFHFAGEARVTMSSNASSGEVGFDAVRLHALSLDGATSSTAGPATGAGGASGVGGGPPGAGGAAHGDTGGGGAGCACRAAGGGTRAGWAAGAGLLLALAAVLRGRCRRTCS